MRLVKGDDLLTRGTNIAVPFWFRTKLSIVGNEIIPGKHDGRKAVAIINYRNNIVGCSARIGDHGKA